MSGRLLALLAAFVLVCAPVVAGVNATVFAQATDCRTFNETEQVVCGKFLDYWNLHGGLAQQGYPISGTLDEPNETDGKTYTVQYFERATFELHPENPAPNNVLLSLLGVFLYKQTYPMGAPSQEANNSAGSVAFAETGKRLGGIFLDYWQGHGALAQQGLPISDEFIEVSALDGKPYRVQYFERAVFEYHPEQVAAYQVLLSQLGTFRYKLKYAGGVPPVGSTATPITVANAPTATAVPPTQQPQPPSGGNPPLLCVGQAGQYCAAATVSNAAPVQNEDVRVTGRLMKDGQGVQGAVMNTTWHYKSKDTPCSGAITHADGYAGCTNGIGRATAGYRVVIDVDFLIEGVEVASTQTEFTPR